ncbi:MAG: hypothetical protein ACPG4T_24305, partial [Nannocystaceae bacterium]
QLEAGKACSPALAKDAALEGDDATEGEATPDVGKAPAQVDDPGKTEATGKPKPTSKARKTRKKAKNAELPLLARAGVAETVVTREGDDKTLKKPRAPRANTCLAPPQVAGSPPAADGLRCATLPTSHQLLALTICDPAMGSGAFLVAACRVLAREVKAAWEREGVLDRLRAGTLPLEASEPDELTPDAKPAPSEQDPELLARRLVAQRCLYGVDKNPLAVDLAKLSLWLETLAADAPFTFLDHALKCGDSLVGLFVPQVRTFHWKQAGGTKTRKKGKGASNKRQAEQIGLFEDLIVEQVARARYLRMQLLDLAAKPNPTAAEWRRKEEL